MKFFGTSKRGGKHTENGVASTSTDTIEVNNGIKGGKKKRKRSVVKITILSIVVTIVAAVGVLALDLWLESEWLVTPPELSPIPRPGRSNPSGSTNPNNPNNPNSPPDFSADPHYTPGRRPITFLILGTDDGSNTDAIMVATFDTEAGTFDVVSIPRDTMVNVRWHTKRANSIYANMRAANSNADNRMEATMNATVDKFADILGFETDFWVLLNLRALSRLVDAIDGVNFYVPMNMNYRDNAAGLHINFRQGMQRINGRQASELLRFRSMGSGDIGRINIQQQFLTAAIEQILANRNNINVTELINIFLNYVETDLDDNFNDLLWMGNQFLRLQPENVNFMTMPVARDSVSGMSLVSIILDEWIEMLNDRINPFAPMAAEDLSILTRGPDRRLFVTDGNWNFNQSWGATSLGPSQPQRLEGTLSGGGGGGGGTQAPRPPATTTPSTPTTPPAEGTTPTTPPSTPNNDPPRTPGTPGGEDVDIGELPDDPDEQGSHEPDDDYFDDPNDPGDTTVPSDTPGTSDPADTPNDGVDTPPEQPDTPPDTGTQVNETPAPEPPPPDPGSNDDDGYIL